MPKQKISFRKKNRDILVPIAIMLLEILLFFAAWCVETKHENPLCSYIYGWSMQMFM